MRVLGLDLGKRRVGVAVSDPDGTIARPLVQFRVQGRGQIVETVHRLVAEQVETWDERFSTDEADAIMDRSGPRGRDRKGRRDMVAAAVILQSYLDARQG